MTKGQKTALGVVAVGGLAVAGYFLWKNSQKNKTNAGSMPGQMPGQMPIYNAQMPPSYQAQPQQRPVLDFFTGLIGSGKVAKGIENIKGAFGKNENGAQPYGPITEEQYNAQNTYSGPFRLN